MKEKIKNIKNTTLDQNQHSRKVLVRMRLMVFIVWSQITSFVGRIPKAFRKTTSAISLEGPRLMLLSRHRMAHMKTGKKVGLSAIGGSAVAIAIVISILVGSQLVAVTVNGQLVGYIENEGQFASLVQQAKHKVSAQIGTESEEILIDEENVSFETVIVPQPKTLEPPVVSQQPTVEQPSVTEEASPEATPVNDTTSNNTEEALVDTLIDSLIVDNAIKTSIYTIEINEEKFATLGTLNEANLVLSSLETSFKPLGGDYTGKWLDNVVINTEVITDLNEVNTENPDDVITKLLSGTSEEISYAALDKDSAENIANQLGISQQSLEGAYPDYNFKKVAEGDVFTTTRTVPLVRYEAQGTEIVSEPIPFETIEEEDEELYLGQKEVGTPGELGEKLVTRTVTMTNGEITTQIDISSEVVKEPVTEILKVGTKRVFSGDGAYVGPSDGSGGGGSGVLGRPLNSWYLSRNITSYHTGADMLAPQGTPIFAAEAGVVTLSQYYGGYGNCIILDHGGGIVTYYAHCDTLNVQVGEGVSRGQQIATVGTTGRSTAYHLHFEVRAGGVVQDPLAWIG